MITYYLNQTPRSRHANYLQVQGSDCHAQRYVVARLAGRIGWLEEKSRVKHMLELGSVMPRWLIASRAGVTNWRQFRGQSGTLRMVAETAQPE